MKRRWIARTSSRSGRRDTSFLLAFLGAASGMFTIPDYKNTQILIREFRYICDVL